MFDPYATGPDRSDRREGTFTHRSPIPVATRVRFRPWTGKAHRSTPSETRVKHSAGAGKLLDAARKLPLAAIIHTKEARERPPCGPGEIFGTLCEVQCSIWMDELSKRIQSFSPYMSILYSLLTTGS